MYVFLESGKCYEFWNIEKEELAAMSSVSDKMKKRANRLKSDIPAVFLALKDARTPIGAKILAACAIAYALSPVDLIPDFIPVIGYLDDLIILPVLVAWTIKLLPPDVLVSCRERAKGMWNDGRPVKWYYAIPVAIFWIIIVVLIVKVTVHGAPRRVAQRPSSGAHSIFAACFCGENY